MRITSIVAVALVVMPALAHAQEAGDEPIEVPDIEIPDIDTSGLDDVAPLEPTPAEPTPAEPTPAEPTPAEPTPAEPTPAEPTPAEQAPTEPTPSEAPPPPDMDPNLLPAAEPAPPPRDPKGGFTSYIEGLTYAPTLQPLSFTVLPTSQSFFDSYVPFFGDEGGASGLWVGYQGTGVAGLATMGLALAGNGLFQFPNDVDVSIPLAAGGFNDRSPLSVGQALLGVYGRLGPLSVALGGAGALESVPAVVGQKNVLGYGLGGAAELAFEFFADNHVIARAAVTQLTPFDGATPGLVKVDPLAGVMLPLFGTPTVVGAGAAIVLGDGREPVIAPRLLVGGGIGNAPNDESPSAAPPLPTLDDAPSQDAPPDTAAPPPTDG